MKDLDYIIVGFGLAGICLADICEREGKSFLVIDQGIESASKVAAGLYNPVILKRYTLPYKAVEQFDNALLFFKSLENKLGVSFMNDLSVRKVFHSIEDQNNWFAASDKDGLKRFLSPSVIRNSNKAVNVPFDYGKVQETGRLAIRDLQKSYINYLEKNSSFSKALFSHNTIVFKDDYAIYGNYRAKYIVFAEGFGVKNNPYFNSLPIVGNKGEYLLIKAPGLKISEAIKSSIFIIPIGNDVYKVGATYNWIDKDWKPTLSAREELIAKLELVINVSYEVIDQEAGVRPTTGDRRPILGVHPKHKQLAIINGLGTRGVMAGPMLAQYLYDAIENGMSIPEELNCVRFTNK
ncbi:NAD(P)/FAD-dependent oxidoreductase [Dokdonia sp. Hel_I_53]|uniref:NAD(P)/FAD-dependent oxidoreductase n=1 Tax=Dokdonia sp. Hel_I_53 TaxID=1566287 RepID=UPI00119A0F69|nr:FAD-dependent oxidoreductase [Dokdonia sp. Hel_I_53]TVZ52142.1 glycine/D-amino acid oxidase-like deaminating enzyme [Dokdonia sp. Hel_I_53]